MKGLNDKVHPIALRQTELTRPNRKIMNLVKGIEPNSIVFSRHKMNKAVSRSIKYLTGSTDINTNAQKAVTIGTGVCQDFAHILIGLARYI